MATGRRRVGIVSRAGGQGSTDRKDRRERCTARSDPFTQRGSRRQARPGPCVRYLVDPASSHMLVPKIKPCMSKYKQINT